MYSYAQYVIALYYLEKYVDMKEISNHINHNIVEFLEPPRESERWYKHSHGYSLTVFE